MHLDHWHRPHELLHALGFRREGDHEDDIHDEAILIEMKNTYATKQTILSLLSKSNWESVFFDRLLWALQPFSP